MTREGRPARGGGGARGEETGWLARVSACLNFLCLPAAASLLLCLNLSKRRGGNIWGVFDMPALEGLASEPGSGQPELGPERPEALFDVFAPTEPG
jgi:hypothetical protein